MNTTEPATPPAPYPIQLTVDDPDRPLNRLTTGLRFIWIIPIGIVATTVTSLAGGLLFWAPLLMIVFRQKYPRWWFDWNLALLRFQNRVGVYALLLRDEYPSTDEEQAVHLEMPEPDVKQNLNRWLPLVKWFLAIPHYIVLSVLWVAGVVVVIIAWFAILFTGRYPKALWRFVVDLVRWTNRVIAYAFVLTTDAYPPFRFGA